MKKYYVSKIILRNVLMKYGLLKKQFIIEIV
jgi:hypothetical protein